MSKENFKLALNFLFPSEGGYVNDKDDKGGPTNMGITQSSYNSYRKRKNLPYENVKDITREEAENIYYEDYWKTSGADKIDDPNMATALFDTAVLHGPQIAIEFYQKSNGNLIDFLNIRQSSYDKIVEKNPSQKKYYQGWNNRVNNLRDKINNGDFTKNKENINTDNIIFSLSAEKNYLPNWEDLMINPKEIYKNNEYNSSYNHIFTPEEIGKMTSKEFSQNEEIIMQQLKEGLIKNNPPKVDYSDYKNLENGSSKIYTREDGTIVKGYYRSRPKE